MSLIKIIEKILKPKCPDCGGVMDCIFIDMYVDKCDYKCRDCGKEWI